MNKKMIISSVVLCVAMLFVVTMTGCGGQSTEPTEPRIKTTIDPKNWARVEDYAIYETEPVETAPTEEAPTVTEPVATEAPTEPAVEETEPPAPTVYYNVAKSMSRAFVTADFGELQIGKDSFNILTTTVADLEEYGFVKGDVEQNFGVSYQYFFDGYKYTKEDVVLYIDADENGMIRAIKIVNPGITVVGDKVAVDMGLNNFYDAIESVLAEGENLGRMTPAEGVKSYTHLASAGYRAVFTCTTEGVKEIAIFAEDYVSTWGPIEN